MKLLKWTIGKKMFLMGFGIVLALGALAGMFYYTTDTIQKGTDISALRNQQLELLNNVEQSVLTLILAAMDSIIDKNDGTISEERMQIINEQITFVQANLDNLEALADTDEEVLLANEIRETFPKLQADIQETLVTLIEESAGELQQIQQDFIDIDDTLDIYGDQIEEDLGALAVSVHQEQIDATNLALLRTRQVAVLDKFLRAHATLMLEAMDVIIDKDSGTIAEDRIQKIQASITFVQANLKQLEELADTEIETAAAAAIRDAFPKLAIGIQEDLVRLVEESAGQLQQIQQDFIRIDDSLDIYGDQIEEDLQTLVVSVRQEQTDAANLALLRNQQMVLLNSFLRTHATLMLETMDSIIDKDAGDIAHARMENITASIDFIQTNLNELEALADTDEEKAAAANIRENFPQLVTAIQNDLVRFIKQFASDEDFERIDDTLDNYGDQIEENLATIFTSVQQEQVEATELSLLRNQQMDVLTRINEAHSNLMLAAMDSIIDKDEGTILDSRRQTIATNIQFVNESLDTLTELADTEQERLAVQSIREMFPKLVAGIQIDLVKLIEDSILKARQIEADFVRIDDELDKHGDLIEENLGIIFASVQQKQVEASQLSLLRNRQMDALNALTQAHSNVMLAAMDSIIDKDEGQINAERAETIDSELEFMRSSLENLPEIADTETEQAAATRIQETFPLLAEGIQVDLTQLIEESVVLARQIEADFVKIDDDLDLYGDKIQFDLEQIVASVQAEQKEAEQALLAVIEEIAQIGAIIILAALVILILVFTLFSRSITNPLVHGADVATRLANGDLAVKVDVRGRDETAQLLGAMDHMVDKLQEIVSAVKSGAMNVASGSQEMAQGASEQAAAGEEASSSMEEMAANIRQNSDNALQTEKIAVSAAANAREGGEAVAETVTAMKDIAQRISIIEEIARQTHMLSLNATIEAAKAQDYGKGFAVVAAEVRALAERSRTAANEINTLAGSSVTTAVHAGELLTKVVPDIQKTAELVQEISAASREQNTGAAQINKAIQQLDNVIQQNASVSEELAAQAEQLQSSIDFFSTGNDAYRRRATTDQLDEKVAHIERTEETKTAQSGSKTVPPGGHSIDLRKNDQPGNPQGDERDSEFERY